LGDDSEVGAEAPAALAGEVAVADADVRHGRAVDRRVGRREAARGGAEEAPVARVETARGRRRRAAEQRAARADQQAAGGAKSGRRRARCRGLGTAEIDVAEEAEAAADLQTAAFGRSEVGTPAGRTGSERDPALEARPGEAIGVGGQAVTVGARLDRGERRSDCDTDPRHWAHGKTPRPPEVHRAACATGNHGTTACRKKL